MPNQRHKGKKSVGAWVPESLRDRIKIVAKRRGVSVSDILCELLTKAADAPEQIYKFFGGLGMTTLIVRRL